LRRWENGIKRKGGKFSNVREKTERPGKGEGEGKFRCKGKRVEGGDSRLSSAGGGGGE